jgi:hypothetical protein
MGRDQTSKPQLPELTKRGAGHATVKIPSSNANPGSFETNGSLTEVETLARRAAAFPSAEILEEPPGDAPLPPWDARYDERDPSTLQIPAPRAAMNRNAKQYKAASSPWLTLGKIEKGPLRPRPWPIQ